MDTFNRCMEYGTDSDLFTNYLLNRALGCREFFFQELWVLIPKTWVNTKCFHVQYEPHNVLDIKFTKEHAIVNFYLHNVRPDNNKSSCNSTSNHLYHTTLSCIDLLCYIFFQPFLYVLGREASMEISKES